MNTNNSKKLPIFSFPAQLVKPVGIFLQGQLNNLIARKRRISKDDPFKDTSRVTDNAAPDADAEEQFGHARVTAIKYEIDKKIVQTRRALTRIKIGKYGVCENCGMMIDTDRLTIYPEATMCVTCETKREKGK
jgi:RNA polymerase-binding transcription factor DksA